MDQRKLDMMIKEREVIKTRELREKRKKIVVDVNSLFKKIESEEEKV
jgi:hypothetical protein